jgi:hypothetical protein
VAMAIAPAELERAVLILVVAPNGSYRWGCSKSPQQVANMLEAIAEDIRMGS